MRENAAGLTHSPVPPEYAVFSQFTGFVTPGTVISGAYTAGFISPSIVPLCLVFRMRSLTYFKCGSGFGCTIYLRNAGHNTSLDQFYHW
jgi:hypothetical protein